MLFLYGRNFFHAGLGLASIVFLFGCTAFTGENFQAHRKTWASPVVTVRVCTNRPDLVGSALPARYGISVTPVNVPTPARGGFDHDSIYDSVVSSWDPRACPRLLIVYPAHFGDHVVWWTFGGVRGETGYTATGESVGFAFDVGDTVEHELYHILGCENHDMAECQDHLASTKKRLAR